MGLKGVELQIAIPKTFDAGKAVEQHQQNVIHQQLNANEALKKEVERKQFTVNDTEEVDDINDEEKDKDKKELEQKLSSNPKNEEKEEQEKAQHPFKGNFIDYSG